MIDKLKMLSGLFAWMGRGSSGKTEGDPDTFTDSTPGLWDSEYGSYLDDCDNMLAEAAQWHAKAARKAVVDLDGDMVLEHMEQFRRCMSITDFPPAAGDNEDICVCRDCGMTCHKTNMNIGKERLGGDYIYRAGRLICDACDPDRADDLWIAPGGNRVPVGEMNDNHLLNSFRTIRRCLVDNLYVSDEDIRICGHVIKECNRRGWDRYSSGLVPVFSPHRTLD